MMFVDAMKETSSNPTLPDLYSTHSGVQALDMSNFSNITNQSTTIPSPPFIPCDNPRNIVSLAVAEAVDFAVYAGIFPVLVVCGITTNVINMAVFARQGLSDRIHLCLFCLAVSDTGFLLFLMCGKSYPLISLVDPVAGDYWREGHNGYVLGSYLGFLSISNTITALIAVERCLCIMSPLKAAKFFKTKYMRAGIIAVAVFTLAVMNTALGQKFQIVQITDPITNTSTFISHLTPFYIRHRTLIEILYMHMLSVTLPSISLVIVIVCTIAIILRLKVMARWRRTTVSNMTSVEKQEVTVTRMLVTVCCVYLVCMIPRVARALILFIRLPGFLLTGYLCNAFNITNALTHLLDAFNASVNFWIYLRQSSHFRSTLRQLCHCVDGKQKKRSREP